MELRLIPEFSGDATQNVVEWLEKAGLVCNLRGIAHLESDIPFRLTAVASREGRQGRQSLGAPE